MGREPWSSLASFVFVLALLGAAATAWGVFQMLTAGHGNWGELMAFGIGTAILIWLYRVFRRLADARDQ